MKLSEDQVSKIEKTIAIGGNKSIVMLDLGGDAKITLNEKNSNIYCIHSGYRIICQVIEKKTKVPFDNDLFVFLEQAKDGKILADRFSGFEYQINLDTGEAIQIGFHK